MSTNYNYFTVISYLIVGNNTVPYYFDEFGASSYFGQNIDEWCYLPNKN